jgi:alcohol dehydrogenase (cytochrome c)
MDLQTCEIARPGCGAGYLGKIGFQPGTIDRKFHAFDAGTGKLLWEFPTNWGGDSRGNQNTLNRRFPGEFPEVPEGGAVWVFAIK